LRLRSNRKLVSWPVRTMSFPASVSVPAFAPVEGLKLVASHGVAPVETREITISGRSDAGPAKAVPVLMIVEVPTESAATSAAPIFRSLALGAGAWWFICMPFKNGEEKSPFLGIDINTGNLDKYRLFTHIVLTQLPGWTFKSSESGHFSENQPTTWVFTLKTNEGFSITE
jgi:hypothetical protein